MNKTITLFLLLLASLTGRAQGLVTFQNSVAFQTVDPTGAAHLIYGCDGPLTGTQYVAELYAGADMASLTPVTASISRFRSTTSANKGKWANTGIYGPNDFVALPAPLVPGAIASLQVKVWDFSTGPTYEGATGFALASSVFTYKVPPFGDNFPADFYMEGLQGVALVGCPEPSAIALGLLGFGGLLMFGRRQKSNQSLINHPVTRNAMRLSRPPRDRAEDSSRHGR